MRPSTPLFARVHVVDSQTLLAADVATPVKNTVALLLSLLSPGVVASATAQQVAPIYAVGRQVADAIPSTEGTSLGIGIAKIR